MTWQILGPDLRPEHRLTTTNTRRNIRTSTRRTTKRPTFSDALSAVLPSTFSILRPALITLATPTRVIIRSATRFAPQNGSCLSRYRRPHHHATLPTESTPARGNIPAMLDNKLRHARRYAYHHQPLIIPLVGHDPGGCRLAGVLPARGRCSYAPVVPGGGRSRRALTTFPQVRARMPVGRGDRI